MDRAELTEDEQARWTAWKRATTTVWDRVTGDIAAATGLSAADFAVLSRVVELGGGSLRQQHLADQLGWHRARLSRQVGRMVERGLLTRSTVGAASHVDATEAGRDVLVTARSAHAGAVRATLLAHTPLGAGSGFWDTVDRLGRTTDVP